MYCLDDGGSKQSEFHEPLTEMFPEKYRNNNIFTTWMNVYSVVAG